jgi:hypothetical protein
MNPASGDAWMAGGGARIEGLEEETRGLGNGGDGSGRKRRERGYIGLG